MKRHLRLMHQHFVTRLEAVEMQLIVQSDRPEGCTSRPVKLDDKLKAKVLPLFQIAR